MKVAGITKVFQNKSFRWLYLSQAINLLGDSISWTGIALLAHKISGEEATNVLSITLTIRVLVFVVVSSYAGVLADRFNRKKLMIITHLLRMGLITLLAFAFLEWHLYLFVFLFSILHSIFTPTYKATVPLVMKDKELYPKAISLSSATYQLLGIFGPGIAGIIVAFLSLKYVFWVDGITFLVSIICILLVPQSLKVREQNDSQKTKGLSIKFGTKLLFGSKYLKRAVLLQLPVSIVGAQLLVNSIFHVKETLSLSDSTYGFVMSALAVGAVLGAITTIFFNKVTRRYRGVVIGSLLGGVLLLFANRYNPNMTIVAWILIGGVQSMANILTDTLIADNINEANQGKVYGAHFAWSHLWWVIGYPIAGLTNYLFEASFFMAGGIVSILFFLLAIWIPKFIRFQVYQINNTPTDE